MHAASYCLGRIESWARNNSHLSPSSPLRAVRICCAPLYEVHSPRPNASSPHPAVFPILWHLFVWLLEVSEGSSHVTKLGCFNRSHSHQFVMTSVYQATQPCHLVFQLFHEHTNNYTNKCEWDLLVVKRGEVVSSVKFSFRKGSFCRDKLNKSGIASYPGATPMKCAVRESAGLPALSYTISYTIWPFSSFFLVPLWCS